MKYYIVDAFTDKPFEGNPAAVCVLEDWPADALMQSIAAENNLSETAFAVKDPSGRADYRLRWFTPAAEVDLCGHATLATAFVIDSFVAPIAGGLKFDTLGGLLEVRKEGDLYELDFPSRVPVPAPVTELMTRALGVTPKEARLARDMVLLLDSEEQIRALQPDFELLKQIPDYLVLCVTAPGKDCDFVSRTFAPKVQVNEDPVCGSAHCSLVPYWAEKLGKQTLHARQCSKRNGELFCRNEPERVRMAGRAALYAEGVILEERPARG